MLDVPEAMRCVLLRMLESRLCLLEALDVLDVLEMMRCVLLCVLEAVEGRFCLLDVPEAMRCVLLWCWRVGSVYWKHWMCWTCWR